MSKHRSETHGPRKNGVTPIHVREVETRREGGKTVREQTDTHYLQKNSLPREEKSKSVKRSENS